MVQRTLPFWEIFSFRKIVILYVLLMVPESSKKYKGFIIIRYGILHSEFVFLDFYKSNATQSSSVEWWLNFSGTNHGWPTSYWMEPIITIANHRNVQCINWIFWAMIRAEEGHWFFSSIVQQLQNDDLLIVYKPLENVTRLVFVK